MKLKGMSLLNNIDLSVSTDNVAQIVNFTDDLTELSLANQTLYTIAQMTSFDDIYKEFQLLAKKVNLSDPRLNDNLYLALNKTGIIGAINNCAENINESLKSENRDKRNWFKKAQGYFVQNESKGVPTSNLPIDNPMLSKQVLQSIKLISDLTPRTLTNINILPSNLSLIANLILHHKQFTGVSGYRTCSTSNILNHDHIQHHSSTLDEKVDCAEVYKGEEIVEDDKSVMADGAYLVSELDLATLNRNKLEDKPPKLDSFEELQQQEENMINKFQDLKSRRRKAMGLDSIKE